MVKIHNFWRTSLYTVENGAQLFARTAVHPYAEMLCICCVVDARYEQTPIKSFTKHYKMPIHVFLGVRHSKSQIVDISFAHSLAYLYDRLSTL